MPASSVASPITSFEAWMISEQRRIFSICWRMLHDADEADSASQDVFLKAFQALNRVDAPVLDDPARWLTSVAIRVCIDRLRSNRWQFWRRRPDPGLTMDMAASPAPGPREQYFAGQIQARLEVALRGLSARQRSVFVLRHYDGISVREIAKIMGVDDGTVKAHLHRARTKLRAELQDLYFSSGQTA